MPKYECCVDVDDDCENRTDEIQPVVGNVVAELLLHGARVTVAAVWSLVMALVLEPPTAPAPEPERPATWVLTWDAPATCPDEAAIRDQVAALVPSRAGGDGVLYVDGRVEPRVGAWVLTLSTVYFARHDAREVVADSCDELAEAVALVVAISLDPSLDLSEGRVPEPVADPHPDPDSAPPPSTPDRWPTPYGGSTQTGSGADAPRPIPARDAPPAPPAPPDDATPRRPATVRSPRAWLVRLGPQLELGNLASVGGGLDLAVGLLWRWVRLELHGAWSWPRRVSGPPPSAARVQMGLVGVRGCARPHAGRVELPVCIGLDAGALRADSRNLDPERTVHAPWLSAGLGVGLAVGGERVKFFTLLEASAAPVRPAILVSDEAIFRSSIVSGRWLAGIELRFETKSGS